MSLITISALYGAGGSHVAPALARRLDVPLLGRPEEPESDVASEGQSGGNLLSRVASLAVSWGTPPGLTTDDLLPDEARRRELEQEVRVFAAHGRGVILGRGAAALLRDHPRTLHVLLDGPKEGRVRQGMAIERIGRAAAERRLASTDRFRHAYLVGLYGVDVDAPGTFHLALDSTAIALPDCVEIIADVARRFTGPSSAG
jgi:cytidylate kinase